MGHWRHLRPSDATAHTRGKAMPTERDNHRGTIGDQVDVPQANHRLMVVERGAANAPGTTAPFVTARHRITP